MEKISLIRESISTYLEPQELRTATNAMRTSRPSNAAKTDANARSKTKPTTFQHSTLHVPLPRRLLRRRRLPRDGQQARRH